RHWPRSRSRGCCPSFLANSRAFCSAPTTPMARSQFLTAIGTPRSTELAERIERDVRERKLTDVRTVERCLPFSPIPGRHRQHAQPLYPRLTELFVQLDLDRDAVLGVGD